MKNFLKNHLAAIFLFLKRSFISLLLSDYCKNFYSDTVMVDLKKELAKNDKDIEDLIVEKIFFLSRTVETLMEIIEDEATYSYETRLMVAKKVILCLGENCPEEYKHLNITRKTNPYRFMNYYRMIRKLRDHHCYIESEARRGLELTEFQELVSQLERTSVR